MRPILEEEGPVPPNTRQETTTKHQESSLLVSLLESFLPFISGQDGEREEEEEEENFDILKLSPKGRIIPTSRLGLAAPAEPWPQKNYAR